MDFIAGHVLGPHLFPVVSAERRAEDEKAKKRREAKRVKDLADGKPVIPVSTLRIQDGISE